MEEFKSIFMCLDGGEEKFGCGPISKLVDNDDVDALFFKFGNDFIRCFPWVARGFAVGNGVHEIRLATGDFDVWIGVVSDPFCGGKVIAPVGWQLPDAFGEFVGRKYI